MAIKFLSEGYIAMALLKAKRDFFDESFITFSELNQFDHFIQQEFNNQDLDIITSNGLSIEDFNFMGEVIMPSEGCCFDLDILPLDISSILNDTNLIVSFLINLESEKLKSLENVQVVTPKLHKKQK